MAFIVTFPMLRRMNAFLHVSISFEETVPKKPAAMPTFGSTQAAKFADPLQSLASAARARNALHDMCLNAQNMPRMGIAA